MITSDWHIHTRNSCDEACIPFADLLTQAAAQGIVDFGISDHLHTPFNLPDIAASRAEFNAHNPSARIHFGIEVSCVSQWELNQVARRQNEDLTYGLRTGGPPHASLGFALTPELKETYGIEYVVAGAHWPMYIPYEPKLLIEEFHRQNMFLVTHPLVDIVAHPWWWHGKWQDADGIYRTEPWIGNFDAIPSSMHDEFAAAAREHDTAIEANISAMLSNQYYAPAFRTRYVEYLGYLKESGVTFSIGSDCHGWYSDIDFVEAENALAPLGFKDEDFWRLPPRTGC